MDEEVVPVLHVEDAVRAIAWYERLGFGKEWEHQFEPGFPGSSPWPVSTSGCTCPTTRATLGRTPLIHLYVTDIDAVSEEFGGSRR